MEKLLLHVCCGPCSTYVVKELNDYEMTILFYNPNIYPKEEYLKRLNAAQKVAEKAGIKVIEGEYDQQAWEDYTKGYEAEPEGGKRCALCFELRLKKSAEIAKQNCFSLFTTTLTISPHKDSKKINEIGRRLGEEFGVTFLESDFKKKDGFLKSLKLSKELGIYRQHYCGCRYSLRRSIP